MDKRRIAIVAGGYSSEFPVSLRSAQGIYSFMDKDRYDIYIVKLTRDEWFVELPDGETSEIDKMILVLSKVDGFVILISFILRYMGLPVKTGVYKAT